MASRRASIEIFSLSMVDMLCCSLGGVIILWVLTFGLPRSSADPPTPIFFRLSQYGVNHILEVELAVDGKSWGPISHATSSNGSPIFLDLKTAGHTLTAPPGSDEPQVSISFNGVPPGSAKLDAISGGVTVLASGIVRPVTVIVSIEQCTARDEVHIIDFLSYSGGQSKRQLLIFQEESRLRASIDVLKALPMPGRKTATDLKTRHSPELLRTLSVRAPNTVQPLTKNLGSRGERWEIVLDPGRGAGLNFPSVSMSDASISQTLEQKIRAEF